MANRVEVRGAYCSVRSGLSLVVGDKAREANPTPKKDDFFFFFFIHEEWDQRASHFVSLEGGSGLAINTDNR